MQMVLMAFLVWTGRMVLMDLKDPRENQVLVVRRVIRVRLVLMDYRVLLENGALLDLRDPKESKENLVERDPREQLDLTVRY